MGSVLKIGRGNSRKQREFPETGEVGRNNAAILPVNRFWIAPPQRGELVSAAVRSPAATPECFKASLAESPKFILFMGIHLPPLNPFVMQDFQTYCLHRAVRCA